jgi:hypothetical protein
MMKKILYAGSNTTHIVSLECIIRLVADRRKETIFFCNISILFRGESKGKHSKRVRQSAYESAAVQKVLDCAIDAATNIRQSTLSDEVFDELGFAIKLMQEI